MNKDLIKKLIAQSLKEDKASADITSNTLIAKSSMCSANIVAREPGIIAGLALAKSAFTQFDRSVRMKVLKKDGDAVKKGAVLAIIKGRTRSILTSERTALNFLGYLSGIATNTHTYVKAVKSTKAKILDTRKTTPTLRAIEKYAVTCGGGVNHRFDLSELVLIKDNHRAMYKHFTSLADAVKDFRKKTKTPIEVEVDTLGELADVLKGKPDYVLLDNMTLAQMRKAVNMTRRLAVKDRPQLEASGGVTLRKVSAIAKTGVDRISIGALTHSRKNFDVSLEITPNV